MGCRFRRGGVVRAIRVVAVGRAAPGPERQLFERYAARIRPALDLVECPDGRGDPASIKRREADAILRAAGADAFVVALDKAGEAPASEALARSLDTWLANARPLVFAVGGAEGLDAAGLARADRTLSFGPQTWPHLLARVMLAEQIWRARAISAGHPYHRV